MKPASLGAAQKSFDLFLSTLPSPDFPGQGLKKTHVRDWKFLLTGYPVRATHMNEFEFLSFLEAVEKNKLIKKPCISNKTINKHLSFIGGFCGWLVENCWLDSNPVEHMLQKVDNDEYDPVPFSIVQLNQLFASPLYTGCVDDEFSCHKPGDTLHSDHRYWVPLIGLFGGLRLGEIAQLRLEDIREVDGVLVFDINRDDGKTTKTKNSVRVVPVHKALLKNGINEYIALMKSRKSRLLFPLMRDGDKEGGQIAANYSRNFGRYLVRIKIKVPHLCFHSSRHSFTDALRRAGGANVEIALLLGHARERITTARDGKERAGTILKRKEMVDAVEYPGVGLPEPCRL